MHRNLSLLLGGLVLAACADAPQRPRGAADRQPVRSHPGGVVARWAQRLGPDGRIPDGAIMAMKRQRDAMLAAQASPAALQTPGIAAAQGAGPTRWQWLGPGNIGGRIRAVAIQPGQGNTMWIGSAGGGIWKTVDGGQSWFPQNDFLPVLPVGCLVMVPGSPNVLYAGTGEGVFDSPSGSSVLAAPRGAGIFTSNDGGQTWSQLPSTSGPEWHFVNRLSYDPNDPKVMLAATGSGIWRTTDGGTTWNRRLALDTFDIEFHPSDSTRAVAGTGTGLAFYTSDGGVSWTAASASSTAVRVEVAYARSAPNTVYANISNNGSISLFKSTDGGVNYGQVGTSTISTYSRYNSTLWVDPTDQNVLALGGVFTHRSTDGGVTVQQVSSGIHPDIHYFVEADGYGSTNTNLFCGNDGGIHRADIRAATVRWQELNNNLGISQFYGAAINPDTGVVVGGLQDNGTLRYSGGTETWTQTFGGDGGYAASDPTNSNYFYGETQNLAIFRSTNGGQSASYIHNSGANPINEPDPNFIPPFLLDPNDPNRMFAGGSQLWRTRAVKAATVAWFPIKPVVPNAPRSSGSGNAHFGIDPPRNISAIAVAEGNADLIWVGHNNGRLYKSTNGNAASPVWTRVDTNAPGLPDRWISRLAIDRSNHARVWVTFQGYNADNLWRTDNGGQSWTRVMGTGANALPTAPITSVALHRVFPGHVYVGTDIGLFWSGDDGVTWSTSNQGAGTAPVDELVWKNARDLMVVTHGRGVYLAETAERASVTSIGAACGTAGGPTLTASKPVLGSMQSYQLTVAAPNAPAVLLLGGAAMPLPLGGGCVLQVPTPIPYIVPVGSTTAGGSAQFGFLLPADASAIGAALTAQVLVQVSGGPLLGVGELSNGLAMIAGL